MKEFVEELVSYAEKVVEKAVSRGFDEAAVSLEASRSAMAKFANSKVTVVQYWQTVSATLYFARNRRVYVIERSISKPENMVKLVEEAASVIDKLDVSEPYAPLPEPSGKPLTGIHDARIVEKLDKVAELADEIISAAQEVEGKALAAGMVELSVESRIVVTSKGARLLENSTGIEAYTRTIIGEASGHWAYTSTHLEEKELRSIGRKSAEYAREARKTVTVEPGEYEAILSPLVVGNLLGDVAWMASGLAVLMGFSVFTKYSIGSRIGSDKLTLIDDPHDTGLPGSTGFDDEGVATKPKPIIEKGVVKSLLHNSKTASAMKTETTGNAGYIMPHPWNIIVSPGDMDEEEMVREVKRGLFVLNNWYTRFQNYVEGVFSTVTRDALLYIENGEVKGSARRLRIADTIPRMLSNVVGASKTLYKVQWWEVPYPTRAPFLLVSRLRFTKPEV